MSQGLIALIIGVALLIVAYQVAQLPAPVRTLLLVFGWLLAIVGGIFVVLSLLGVSVGAL